MWAAGPAATVCRWQATAARSSTSSLRPACLPRFAPPPNQSTAFFGLVYGEELAPVPGPEELLAVFGEMSITPEVIEIGAATARRPLPETREEAIKNELGIGWVRPDDIDRAHRLFNEHFDELFLETSTGFARRDAVGVRELMITWEPSALGPNSS